MGKLSREIFIHNFVLIAVCCSLLSRQTAAVEVWLQCRSGVFVSGERESFFRLFCVCVCSVPTEKEKLFNYAIDWDLLNSVRKRRKRDLLFPSACCLSCFCPPFCLLPDCRRDRRETESFSCSCLLVLFSFRFFCSFHVSFSLAHCSRGRARCLVENLGKGVCRRKPNFCWSVDSSLSTLVHFAPLSMRLPRRPDKPQTERRKYLPVCLCPRVSARLGSGVCLSL